MSKKLTAEQKESLIKKLPGSWNYWSYRMVSRVRMKNAFYFKWQILKVKCFATFGAFDHKDRWVSYYDIGPELKPTFWVKIWFNITRFL